MRHVRYLQAGSRDHLEGILWLQRRNVEEALSPEEVVRDGFVTVRHDLSVLTAMNADDPHIVAIDGDRVVGYALVMPPRFERSIPILAPMFDQVRTLRRDGRPLDSFRYFVMGQVCVDRDFRGQGVFGGMFTKMRDCYGTRYDFTLTEVARRNGRSIRAHEKVGFALWHRYTDPHGEEWDLIGWDWR